MTASRKMFLLAVLSVSNRKNAQRDVITEPSLDGGVKVSVEGAATVTTSEVADLVDFSAESVRRMSGEFEDAEMITVSRDCKPHELHISAPPEELFKKVELLDE